MTALTDLCDYHEEGGGRKGKKHGGACGLVGRHVMCYAFLFVSFLSLSMRQSQFGTAGRQQVPWASQAKQSAEQSREQTQSKRTKLQVKSSR